MIDLYYWPTPNGWKITVMLAECGLDYRVHPVNLREDAQFAPDFAALSPNNKIPAIVDNAPADGGAPLSLFESGAILLYLAEKTGRLMPTDLRGRKAVHEWLMWQVGGLGPMCGQNGHFLLYARQKIPYAIERYAQEVRRLYGVLDAQLGRTQNCVAGEYSIADIAIFPWIVTHKAQGLDLAEFPCLARWFGALRARPAVAAGMEVLRASRTLDKRAHAAPAATPAEP